MLYKNIKELKMSKTIAAVERKRERARGEEKNSPASCLKIFYQTFPRIINFQIKKHSPLPKFWLH